MSHDDDIRLDRCEQLDAAVDIVDHRASSLVLAIERAGGPVCGHPMEMHGNPLGRQCDHLGLYRRISRRQQKPQPRSPTNHAFLSALKSESPSPPPRAPRAEREMFVHCQTTPLSRSRFTSSGAIPQSSLNNESVCSPRSGGRLTSAGESDNLIGQPTVL